MESAYLPLAAFVSIAVIAVAGAMLLRDLIFSNRAPARDGLGRGEVLPEIELRPLETGPDKEANGSSESRFSRLVAESGAPFTAAGSLLFMVAVGLLVGGSMYVWREDWITSAGAGVIGVVVVLLLWTYLAGRRRRAMLEQLPGVVEFLARAIRSGASLDQGIAQVGESGFRPLAATFRRCARQLEMGLSVDSAMRTLTRRAPLVETRILAAALRVQRQTGGSLPAVLDRLSVAFRDRLSFFRQIRAHTATSRASVSLIVLLALVVDVYALVWRPQYAQEVLAMPAGRILVGVALALQVLGIGWAFFSLRSEY